MTIPAPGALGSSEWDSTDATVDAQHPWPGLASYRELQHEYFFGRDSEIDALYRRVTRRSLTILFGQSGLGKTSLLHAGLFPVLRKDGILPVSIRLDYARSAPALDLQVRSAIAEAVRAAGGTMPGDPAAPATLWEVFHDPERAPRGPGGRPIVTVLVFDQFEEMFTRGYATDAGRARATEFVNALAAVVERWVPSTVEGLLARDPALAERLEYDRDDVRVLISLREDYLPHLEELRPTLPSIGGGGMRLTRMSATEGVEAVIGPGSIGPGEPLVAADVAQQIMRFVSRTKRSGSELQSLDDGEVEPSLLSLFCRELNARRLAKGLPRISAELLLGSSEDILADFYNRALCDQPPAVRAFVEDELVTDSGVRENMAVERAERRLARDGVAPGALDVLVSRRLLHIEERLGTRRVELTHDVLLPVIERSRVERRQREQLEEAQRKEAEARRLLVERNRKTRGLWGAVAVLSALLVWAVAEMRRASDEEKRVQAESALSSQFVRGVAQMLEYAVDSSINVRAADYYFLQRGQHYLDSLRAVDPTSLAVMGTKGLFTIETAHWNVGYIEVLDSAHTDSLRRAARDSTQRAIAVADDLVRLGPEGRHQAYDLLWWAAEAQRMIGDSDAGIHTLERSARVLRDAERRADVTEPRAPLILARLDDVLGQWNVTGKHYAMADSAFARAASAEQDWAGLRSQADSQAPVGIAIARFALERGRARAFLGDTAAYRRAYSEGRDTVRALLHGLPAVSDSAASTGTHTRADSEAINLSLAYDDFATALLAGKTSTLPFNDSAGALDALDHEMSIDSLLTTRYHDRSALANLAYTSNQRARLRLARHDYAGSVADYAIRVATWRGIVKLSDHQSGDSTALARALGSYSWALLLAHRAPEALTVATEASKFDSSETFVWTNIADALLLTGRYDSAMRVYKKYWRAELDDGTTFGQSVLGDRKHPTTTPGDFHDLEAAGITDPALERAKRQLRSEFPTT